MADTETKLNEDPKNVQDLTGFVPFLIIPASTLILSCFVFVGDVNVCVNEAVLSFFIWCFVVVKNLCSGNCSYFQAKFLDCWI